MKFGVMYNTATGPEFTRYQPTPYLRPFDLPTR